MVSLKVTCSSSRSIWKFETHQRCPLQSFSREFFQEISSEHLPHLHISTNPISKERTLHKFLHYQTKTSPQRCFKISAPRDSSKQLPKEGWRFKDLSTRIKVKANKRSLHAKDNLYIIYFILNEEDIATTLKSLLEKVF